MRNKTGLITSREYFSRVSKKSFILTTLLTPLAMVAMMIVPVVLMQMAGNDTKTILVVDDTRQIAPMLESSKEIIYQSIDEPVDSIIARGDFDAVLAISDSVTAGTAPLRLFINGASSITIESDITRQVNHAIEQARLKNYNIDNLEQILNDVHSDVSITTVRTDRDEGESASAMVSYGLGMVLTFVLYMFLLLYGQMVMTGIIEEKNNRVLEIMVSSIKPTQLMLGKIIGIGLVALTQIVLWCILLSIAVAFIMPAIMPAEAATEIQQLQAGQLNVTAIDTDELEIIKGLAMLSNISFLLTTMGWLTLFLIGGFLFYSAINAAIGSAVDNIQDAGQLQTIVVLPIVIGLIASMTAAAEPTSRLAFWLSMIPFTSPMVMMARVPAGIPTWEIILSFVILLISIYFVIWIAAKIYRVGIFMYGKKPSLKELIKWVQYK